MTFSELKEQNRSILYQSGPGVCPRGPDGGPGCRQQSCDPSECSQVDPRASSGDGANTPRSGSYCVDTDPENPRDTEIQTRYEKRFVTLHWCHNDPYWKRPLFPPLYVVKKVRSL